MICAWEAFLNLLPIWMRKDVAKHGSETLQELRLRIGLAPELRFQNRTIKLQRSVTGDDLLFTVNNASAYSPWSAQTTASGYITAPGGHRLGICGDAVVQNGLVTGVRNVTSLCIRVARDYRDITKGADAVNGSVLIIGKPGCGKTTFLRDMIRRRSNEGIYVSVVDERGEIFPKSGNKLCFETGKRTDIVYGCPKQQGIDMVLRTMGPDVIAVDEITAAEDCIALVHAGWCGVDILATAHAAGKMDLYKRPIYRPLIESKLFQTLIVLKPDKTWSIERMDK